jgi:hypothetical protein
MVTTTSTMASERPPQHQQQQLWVFELCALGGVPISIHYTLVLLVFIQVFAATLSYHFNLYNALMFLLYGPVMFITVFIVSDIDHLRKWLFWNKAVFQLLILKSCYPIKPA